MDRTHLNVDAATHAQMVNITEILVFGTARIIELQASAARALLHSQGRSAALLGAPDWSYLFDGRTGEQLSTIVETSAEQTVRFLRTANETVAQIQRQLGELVEQHTQQMSEHMRQSLDEMSRRSGETVDQLARTAQSATDPVRNAGEAALARTQRPEQPDVPASPIITPAAVQAAAGNEERARTRR